MQHLSSLNDNYKHFLTCIDILSKYAWAIHLKYKEMELLCLPLKRNFQNEHKNLYKQMLEKNY